MWMVPFRCDPDCCQVSVNVPEKAPLYCPDQVPSSELAVVAELVAAELLGVAAGALAAGADECAVVLLPGSVELLG
jgi:hypothetical protein